LNRSRINDETVQVLLATYNGERFLREQIESILAQTYAAVEIVARDDGSTDGTRAILQECATRYPERVQVLSGPPTGAAKTNFARLLEASTASYVAFSDQDDVWVQQKLELEMATMRELERQHGAETPLLVFSDLCVVNERLETIAGSFWAQEKIEPGKIHRLERLLMQNVLTGSTALLNAPLARLARRMPSEAYMHDWWVALVACAMGFSAAVAQPLVRYRQHDSNLLGAEPPEAGRGLPKWRQHEKRRERWEDSVRQAEGLLRVYEEVLPASAASRLRALLRCDSSSSSVRRVLGLLGNGFFADGVRGNLAMLWYLWDKRAASQAGDREGRSS
jgi:glycosyltransferase involved in cell wall biosynthesis